MAVDLKGLMEKRQEIAVYEERNRLARELHDSAKQQAFAASFQLGSAIEHYEIDPEEGKRHLLEAEKLVDSVRRELIDLIHELRPPAMSGRCLDETLNDYAIEWAHQNNIEVNFDANGRKEIPLEVKQSLYRILQEILSNTARHSQAKQVDIKLDYDTNTVELSIRDDGVGFEPQESHKGMGLKSITERTEASGGDLIIESAPGSGTKISVRFPINTTQEF
jgi:NarL family two-component system sensor histidine kinase LiaS